MPQPSPLRCRMQQRVVLLFPGFSWCQKGWGQSKLEGGFGLSGWALPQLLSALAAESW